MLYVGFISEGRKMKAVAALVAIALSSVPCFAQDRLRIAVFDFDIVNTSPAPTTPEEAARLRRLSDQFRDALAASGRYDVVDLAPVREKLASEPAISHCNGCELDLARILYVDRVAYGWVQKVSNLILNINIVIEGADGRKRVADSVDIRGNTDESWQRGLNWLLRERVFRAR